MRQQGVTHIQERETVRLIAPVLQPKRDYRVRTRALILLTALTLVFSACSTLSTPDPQLSTAATCSTTNLALNKSATASSSENAGFLGANLAVDGDAGTRWASAASDPQWLQVDLGSVQTICGVTLQWEAAYGKAFEIQVSNDGSDWTSVYSKASGTGGTQTITLTTAATGQYVRLYGAARATGYGYSLFEFKVFGGADGTTHPPTTGDGWIRADPPVTGVSPSTATLPNKEHKEL